MIAKRWFDAVVAGVLLLVLSPFFLLIALAVAATSGLPVFYRAARAGRDGVTFDMLKFRTMRVGAAGPSVTGRQDPRITPIGAVLRRTKLDELPQLLNVLCGQMSLVGPRPEDPRFVARYTAEQLTVLTVRPGITSPAAIRYRDEEQLLSADGVNLDEAYATTIMPAKLAIDLDYVRQRTFWRDIAILFQSVVVVMHPARDDSPPVMTHT
jgi:lipopolysaccharide/colanic/teichoic acid biosynthesis glycosyltransferase